MYTLGGFVGQSWKLARLAKCAIFRNMLVGREAPALKDDASSLNLQNELVIEKKTDAFH